MSFQIDSGWMSLPKRPMSLNTESASMSLQAAEERLVVAAPEDQEASRC
jgi:hypothetical protein